MHTQLLAISAAILLMSSSVTALGNSEDFLGGLTNTVTDSDLLYPGLALAQGERGGLRRRKVDDLANGPRYGFPATEKKATFGQEKRSIVKMLTEAQGQPAFKGAQQSGDDNDDNDEEGGAGGREAKRSLKAIRRRKAKRDLKGAAFKGQMGTTAILDESQKLVTNTQTSANKIVGQLGRTADGMALSLSDHPAQSKASTDAKEAAGAAPGADADADSNTTPDTGADKKATTPSAGTSKTAESNGATEPEGSTPQAPEAKSPTGNSTPSDNLKINPDYRASGSGDQAFDSGSNYNANYFDE